MTETITQGSRVEFSTRESGNLVTLTGTVTRPVWGRGQNVSIKADDGRTFVRLLAAVRKI